MSNTPQWFLMSLCFHFCFKIYLSIHLYFPTYSLFFCCLWLPLIQHFLGDSFMWKFFFNVSYHIGLLVTNSLVHQKTSEFHLCRIFLLDKVFQTGSYFLSKIEGIIIYLMAFIIYFEEPADQYFCYFEVKMLFSSTVFKIF